MFRKGCLGLFQYGVGKFSLVQLRMYKHNILTCYLNTSQYRGSAWRDNREFVGQINYGAVYTLWNPQSNMSFGANFRSAARCLLMCQRRAESPFANLPDECVYYILNMCRWDWVNDTSDEMRRSQRQVRRSQRRRLEQEADQMLDEAAAIVDRVAGANDDLVDTEEDEESEFMDDSDEDSDDDSIDSDESADEEYRWGDHVNARDAQAFQLPPSDESDSDDEMDEDELHHQSRFQHRGSLVHRSFFSARSHIFNVLNRGDAQDGTV